MKLKFNLKNKEASLDADIEGIVEKTLAHNSTKPMKKTKYQIRQEEKRKNKELEQKQLMQGVILMACLIVFMLLICFIGSKLWQ